MGFMILNFRGIVFKGGNKLWEVVIIDAGICTDYIYLSN